MIPACQVKSNTNIKQPKNNNTYTRRKPDQQDELQAKTWPETSAAAAARLPERNVKQYQNNRNLRRKCNATDAEHAITRIRKTRNYNILMHDERAKR